MMTALPQEDNTFEVLARLAADPKGTQTRLGELAKATHEAEAAKRAAAVAVKEADERTAKAEKNEHIALRRKEDAHAKELSLSEKTAEFDERERVYNEETTRTRKEFKAQETSLNQREDMLERQRADMTATAAKAEAEKSEGKALKDEFLSKISRIAAIATE